MTSRFQKIVAGLRIGSNHDIAEKFINIAVAETTLKNWEGDMIVTFHPKRADLDGPPKAFVAGKAKLTYTHNIDLLLLLQNVPVEVTAKSKIDKEEIKLINKNGSIFLIDPMNQSKVWYLNISKAGRIYEKGSLLKQRLHVKCIGEGIVPKR